MYMFKIRNTEIPDKWDFQYTCYDDTATQNLKDARIRVGYKGRADI